MQGPSGTPHCALAGITLTVCVRPGIALAVAALGALSAATPGAQSSKAGLDVTAFDRRAQPQDDLCRCVNGGWLARTPMPPDRVS